MVVKKKVPADSLIFAICVSIALLLWLLIKLSQSYTGQIPVKLRYVNLPTDKVLVTPPRSSAMLTVNTSGFKLISADLGLFSKTLTLDYSNFGRRSSILINNHHNDFAGQLSSDMELLSISPDTLDFHFDEKVSKRVPVKLTSEISFLPQFNLAEDIILTPDSATIAGPEVVIDTIWEVVTEPLKLKDLDKNYVTDLLLASPAEGIEVRPGSVNCLVPVEEYTEQEVEVDIEMLNVPKGMEIIIYPKKLNVTFLVGMTNYEAVKNTTFEAVVDFSGIDIYENRYIDIQLVHHPSYIRNIALSPKTAEYIIYNN